MIKATLEQDDHNISLKIPHLEVKDPFERIEVYII